MRSKFSEKVIATIMNSDTKKLRKLTVQELAKQFGYNRCYFSIKFKKETQMLVSKCIQNERLERASTIIKIEKNTPISEISKNLGFNKNAYFRNIFKKKYGITPGLLKKVRKYNKIGS